MLTHSTLNNTSKLTLGLLSNFLFELQLHRHIFLLIDGHHLSQHIKSNFQTFDLNIDLPELDSPDRYHPRLALLHKDLKVKTSHIYSNLSDNSGMWSA